jgi:hypothetical protein
MPLVTRKRVRAYATLIALCLWTIWLIDISRSGPIDRLGKVKGTDFIHFYVIGSIAREHAWPQLFDANAHYARTQAMVADPPLFLPIESPQTSLIVAPFTRLPYSAALLAWVAVILTTYIGCCWALWRDCVPLHQYRREVVAACAAFPGIFSVVLHGQTSFLGLACVVGFLAALRRRRRFVAGCALGLLVFKPHWLLAAGAVLLVIGEWRAIAGAATAGAVQTAATWAAVGSPVMAGYFNALRELPGISELLEPRPGDSLKGFVKLFVGSEPVTLALYAAAAVTTLIVAARVWRSHAPFELRAPALVLAMMLVSPHANTYDLVLLGPVLMLTATWLEQRQSDRRPIAMVWLIVALFFAPLAVSLPAFLRLQFSVTSMAALLLLLWRYTTPVPKSNLLCGLVPWPGDLACSATLEQVSE